MATEKAYRLAYKNLYYFDLFDNHTIWHPATAYFGATKVLTISQPEPPVSHASSLLEERPLGLGEAREANETGVNAYVCEIRGTSTRRFLSRVSVTRTR
jgi:hypothetical protein